MFDEAWSGVGKGRWCLGSPLGNSADCVAFHGPCGCFISGTACSRRASVRRHAGFPSHPIVVINRQAVEGSQSVGAFRSNVGVACLHDGRSVWARRASSPRAACCPSARRARPVAARRDGELLIDVESLNIDAASFKQIKERAGGDPAKIDRRRSRDRRASAARCRTRSPARAGCSSAACARSAPESPRRAALKAGDRIATLVSADAHAAGHRGGARRCTRIDRVDVRATRSLRQRHLREAPSDMPDTLRSPRSTSPARPRWSPVRAARHDRGRARRGQERRALPRPGATAAGRPGKTRRPRHLASRARDAPRHRAVRRGRRRRRHEAVEVMEQVRPPAASSATWS